MRPYIIGIAGLKGAGKDTAAAFMAERAVELGYKHIARVAFADTIRTVAYHAFGLDMDWDDRDLKEAPIDEIGGLSPREILQQTGSALRAIYDGVLREAVCRKIETMAEDGAEVIFVTDVRFEDEVALIYELGGEMCFVWRGWPENTETFDGHVSERMAWEWATDAPPDHVIEVPNVGDLDGFRKQCSWAFKDLIELQGEVVQWHKYPDSMGG